MRRRLYQLLVLLTVLGQCSLAVAGPKLRNVCRVKGQEKNTLHGLGLVVGLRGTGDADAKPTARALATTLKLMGNPLAPGQLTDDVLKELRNAKNVALVFVTTTVPAAGARQGDQIQCEVSAISAGSLAGGRLMLTPLLGPRPGSDRVYAFAEGAVEIDNAEESTTGRIHNGCRLEADFRNTFVKDNKITLVLDKNHAGFGMASGVADTINTYAPNAYQTQDFIARAVDQINIEVEIPQVYRDDPVLFLSDILRRPMVASVESQARVVLDEATGTVVIGAEVEIGPVAVSHRNITVQTGGNFVGVDPAEGEQWPKTRQNQTAGGRPENELSAENTHLQVLVNALNAIRVPPSDIISIIRKIDESGQLYGKVIVP